MPKTARVYNVNPFAGSSGAVIDTTDLTLAHITTGIPNYLVISNRFWSLNSPAMRVKPILSDGEFSLIKIPAPLSSRPLLIGMRNDLFYLSWAPEDSFVLKKQAWIEFLSPAKCQGELSAQVTLSPQGDSKVGFMVASQPAGQEEKFPATLPGRVEIPFSLAVGYNLVSVQVLPETLNEQAKPLTVGFSAIGISYSACNP